jgi:hypothetical protein
VRLQHIAEPAALELVAGDVRQHYAIAIWKGELPRVGRAGRVCQLRVCLEQVHHGMCELPHLLQRAADDLVPRRRGQRELLRVRVPDRLPLPVLDLEDQQPPAGVKDHEVRVPVLRADRDVVPAEVVVFEVTAQAGSKAPLAGGGLARRNQEWRGRSPQRDHLVDGDMDCRGYHISARLFSPTSVTGMTPLM